VVASNWTPAGELVTGSSFQSAAGTTYRIAVDGSNGVAGNAVVRLLPAAAPVVAYSNAFEIAEGFVIGPILAGQGGWLSTFTAGSGIGSGAFSGGGQHGYIGSLASPLPGGVLSVYRPLGQYLDIAHFPVIEFSVLMQLPNLLGLYHDTFGWTVRNASGHELFRLTFNNSTHGVNYALDNGVGAVPTGVGVDNTTIYTLRVTMNFGRNTWSATLNGAQLTTNLPISASGAELSLGDIGALAEYLNPSQPGRDSMLFDNFSIVGAPSPVPAILAGPQDQVARAGDEIALEVVAAGDPPLSYQWYHDVDVLTGATNGCLDLKNVAANQSGTYSVLVWNSSGSVSAAAAVLITNPPANAAFSGPVRPGTGGVQLSLNVAAGNTYRLQASTNLRDWSTLGAFFASGTNAVCNDPAAGGYSRRFYRVIAP
jgi:hypothetical protein